MCWGWEEEQERSVKAVKDLEAFGAWWLLNLWQVSGSSAGDEAGHA